LNYYQPMRLGLSTNFSIMRLGFFFLLFFLTACEQVPDAPLRITAHNWPGYEFMFFAQQEKWLDQQKVQLIPVKSATESMQALKEGRIDGAALTLDEVLRLREAGVNLSIVLVFDISVGADMLLAKPGIKQLDDLKNKRVGVEQSALGAVMLSLALANSGLTVKDIQRVDLSVERHRQAWKEGKIDALITFEPVAGQLLEEGAKRLFDSREIPNMIVDVLVIRQELLKTYKTAIRHLIEKHFKAMLHFHENVQDATYRMASRMQTEPEKVVNLYKGLLLPDTNDNLKLISGVEPELLENAKLLSKIMLESKILTRQNELTDLFNANFLPRQIAESRQN